MPQSFCLPQAVCLSIVDAPRSRAPLWIWAREISASASAWEDGQLIHFHSISDQWGINATDELIEGVKELSHKEKSKRTTPLQKLKTIASVV